MAKNKVRKFIKESEKILRQKPKVSAVYLTLRLAVILTMIAQFFNRNYENVFLCGLTLILLILPTVLERRLQVDFPDTLEIIVMLFIFSAEILGEIEFYYIRYPHWDLILHTMNGFLCAAIGFSLVDLFDRSEKFSLTLSPVFMAIVAFCFSMTIGVLWEFFEYSVDYFLLLDMQKDTVTNVISTVTLDPTGGNRTVIVKNITDMILVTGDGEQIALGLGGYLDVGLHDTMEDLFVNFIGAFIFSVIGYFYVKNRGHGKFAKRFIPQILEEETGKESHGN